MIDSSSYEDQLNILLESLSKIISTFGTLSPRSAKILWIPCWSSLFNSPRALIWLDGNKSHTSTCRWKCNKLKFRRKCNKLTLRWKCNKLKLRWKCNKLKLSQVQAPAKPRLCSGWLKLILKQAQALCRRRGSGSLSVPGFKYRLNPVRRIPALPYLDQRTCDYPHHIV